MSETLTIDKARWERLIRFVQAYVKPYNEDGDHALHHSADGKISDEQWDAFMALQTGDMADQESADAAPGEPS